MSVDALDWLQAIRLVAAVGLTIIAGTHAYWKHRQEALRPMSSQRWVFWIYAAAFLVASVLNFGQAWLVLAFGGFSAAPVLLGYATLLITLSYVAFVVGTRVSQDNPT